MYVSTSSSRSNPKALSGATVGSAAYVYAGFTGSPSKVAFFVDSVQAAGIPYSSDAIAPYDLVTGSTATVAKPFNATSLSTGQHTMTAVATYAGGATSHVSAVFTVGNGPSASLVTGDVSVHADRSSPVLLPGATVSGSVYLFASVSGTATSVAFYLDDPATKKAPANVDTASPYDLVAGGTTGAAKPYNMAMLTKGQHSLTIVAKVTNVGTVNRTIVFNVS